MKLQEKYDVLRKALVKIEGLAFGYKTWAETHLRRRMQEIHVTSCVALIRTTDKEGES